MQKILLAINPAKLNSNTIDFACYIAKLTRSELTAIFLEYLEGERVPTLKAAYGGAYVETVLQTDLPGYEDLARQWEQSVQAFENVCKNRGITCCIHQDRGMPIEQLVAESRFGDLLIVDAEMSFSDKAEGLPSKFVKDVLARSECPVVIAPYGFNGVDEILFAYDGSASSVFAVKQFTYLIPEFKDKKVTILQVKENEAPDPVDNQKIRELLQMHYGGIEFIFLHGKAADQLFAHLLQRKNVFVVMGAFGRTMLSAFFKNSTAELLIKTVNDPVFIAHR